jgi:ADP-ribose pyrophosphatase
MTREVIYRGRKIQVALETGIAADGRPFQRDIILHPGAVVVLPMVAADRVCLLRNHRPNVDATLIELPAGTLEPGEDPAVAAPRELAEETGYRAARWQKLTAFYPSPGVLSEMLHLYVAEVLTPGPMALEADEQLEPFIVDWATAVGWALDGTITDAKTLVALLLWDRKRGS